MVDFWVYDVVFLVLFSIWVAYFIIKNWKSIDKEGIMFLYRTQAGVKKIDKFAKRNKGFLKFMRYPIVLLGFILMASMVYLLGRTLYTYIRFPEITQVIKAPPIAPLIPYFPNLFGLQSFFPPFYFTYFLVALAIVAIVHEFSHGIFMRLSNIRIKSTGLVFLGPILGAFVEEDKGQFDKKKKFDRMAVMAAGVFANVLFATLFFVLYILFFYLAFAPSGYVFNTYPTANVNVSSIDSYVENGNLTKYFVGDEFYYSQKGFEKILEENISTIRLYEDVPAVREELKGVIVEINNTRVRNVSDLQEYLLSTEPGDVVRITTLVEEERKEFFLELDEHPAGFSYGYIGRGHVNAEPRGFVQKFISGLMSFKESSTYYAPKWDGNFVFFVYHLLWWVALINILVALFNMLPLGILDGGGFFYLAIYSISGSEKFAKVIRRIMKHAIILVFVLMMVYWLFGIL